MGISRIEQPEKNHFGYYVRLMWRGNQHAKFFSDKKYGGKQQAWKAAEQYFDELDQKMPLDSQVGRMSVRNRSGIVGVSRTKSSRHGHCYEYWQAWWGSGNQRKSVKFSIHKYGETEAKELAIKARKKWEQEASQG